MIGNVIISNKCFYNIHATLNTIEKTETILTNKRTLTHNYGKITAMKFRDFFLRTSYFFLFGLIIFFVTLCSLSHVGMEKKWLKSLILKFVGDTKIKTIKFIISLILFEIFLAIIIVNLYNFIKNGFKRDIYTLTVAYSLLCVLFAIQVLPFVLMANLGRINEIEIWQIIKKAGALSVFSCVSVMVLGSFINYDFSSWNLVLKLAIPAVLLFFFILLMLQFIFSKTIESFNESLNFYSLVENIIIIFLSLGVIFSHISIMKNNYQTFSHSKEILNHISILSAIEISIQFIEIFVRILDILIRGRS